ncbi:MAG: hypothetical protein CMJ46_08730 [Planctomyces sp.]|nr:hypothetical protein [Planctomyces sp.]
MLRSIVTLALTLISLPVLSAQEAPLVQYSLQTDVAAAGKTPSKAVATDVAFDGEAGAKSASFDGRDSEIVVDKSPLAEIGTGDFTLSLWVNASEETDDVIGDLLSQYDPEARRGFNLSIKTNSGVTSSQANYRQLQFGIDNAQLETEWADHGRLGNAVFIYSLATIEGALYAGTCEADVNGKGHLYRFEGAQNWHDCGTPDDSNAISAIAEFDGEIYVATSKYRLAGSALEESPNTNWGGKIFKYNPDGTWTHCGTLPDVEAINGLVVYRDKLYASSTYKPGGLFRYEGGTEWTDCGLPDGKRVESLTVYNGHLYATGYDEAGIYRFDGSEWTKVGQLEGGTQTYGFAIYEGELYVTEWPNAYVYRYESENNWKNVGRLDEELESMPLIVYNGKMYCGSLPLAAVFRYDGDDHWTNLGRVDMTPDVKYRRAWSMSIHDGRLFVGTIPSGRVLSIAAGVSATHDHTFPSGWHHVTAMRKGNQLHLYIDGERVSSSETFDSAAYDLSNDQPLKIGNGQHDHFHGQLRDVKIYGRALSSDEIKKLSQQ